MLLVQTYLRSGKTLEDLKIEHGINFNEANGKVGLTYNQIEASATDPLANQCRGLVLRKDSWDIVACPMFRFFNDNQATLIPEMDKESSSFQEKMDGTCIVVYYDFVLGKWCCGTWGSCEATGSTDNPELTFAMLVDIACNEMRREKNPFVLYTYDATLQDLMADIEKCQPSLDAKNRTFVFELVSPFNRIVCKYNKVELYLLAVRDNITLQEEEPNLWADCKCFNLKLPHVYSFSNVTDFVAAIQSWNPEDHEGVVVRDKYFNRIKIKSPQYSAYNHMRDSLSTSIRGCVEVILLGKEDDVIGMMSTPIAKRIERLKPVIQEVLRRTQKDFEEIKDIDDMKHYASEAVLRLWPAALFALKRNKTPDLNTFALGNQPDSTKIPGSAVDAMIDLCRKIDPDVVKLMV